MNYQEILFEGSNILKFNNIKSFNLDSELLLSSILKIDRSSLILNLEKKIKNKETKVFFDFIERRKKNEPIAYILNRKEFWRDNFFVDKGVLVPRPETDDGIVSPSHLIKVCVPSIDFLTVLIEYSQT